MTIWHLERKILNSIPLSQDEMRVVEQATRSHDLRSRVLAAEGFLRLGNDEQKNIALRVLSVAVRDANSGAGEFTSDLLMAFFLLPLSVLEERQFRTALTNSASHTDEGVRGNCMVALAPLAKAGRSWAENLLMGALQDPSAEVRQNARASLRAASRRREGADQ